MSQPIKVFRVMHKLDPENRPVYSPFVDGFSSPIYIDAQGNEYNGLRTPGMIIDCMAGPSREHYQKYAKADGQCLMVVLPTLETWIIDGPSSNGPGWERTGNLDAGTLHCDPSILTDQYHGWLHNGYLHEC